MVFKGEEEDISAEEFFHGNDDAIVAMYDSMVHSRVEKREINLRVYDRDDLVKKLTRYYNTCPY